MILNTVNLKVYIGSSNNLLRRKREHFLLLRRNAHKNTYLQNAFNKYEEKSFTFIILEKGISLDELLEREIYHIVEKDSINKNKGYNLCMPELNGGPLLSEDGKEKVRRARYIQLYGDIIEEDYSIWKQELDIKKNKPKRDTIVIATDMYIATNVQEFDGPTEAANKLGLRMKRIQECLCGSRKYYGGYSFKYKIPRK